MLHGYFVFARIVLITFDRGGVLHPCCFQNTIHMCTNFAIIKIRFDVVKYNILDKISMFLESELNLTLH